MSVICMEVSVVLNLHREALLLTPTLLSLDACAREAKAAGISVELIAVFDRSDDATRDAFNAQPMQGFCRIETVEVDVGSLGLARNAGVERATGEYIWTSDSDDLVSSNSIVALLQTARKYPSPNVVVFIEYLCAFGDRYHNVRYFDSKYLTAADFAYQHPYISRIFLPKAVFDSLRYDDLRIASGFAYEDWHFNCNLRAHGYEMVVAPDTVIFYRQRNGSLLRQADAASSRLVPHGPLFDRRVFLADMQRSRMLAGSWSRLCRERQEIFSTDNTQLFTSSSKLMGYLHEAAELEPEIEPYRVESAGSYSPMPWSPAHWGVQLESFYRMIGEGAFTDIVLLPWLRPGGGEKYILQILDAITEQESGSRLLVVAGESAPRHEWVARLPAKSVFIDICNAFPSMNEAERDAMLIRALLAVSANSARLHVKSSGFAHRLLDSYAPVMSASFRVVYYRFCDGTYSWGGKIRRGPWGIGVMRKHLQGFWRVVTDCHATLSEDQRFLGPVPSYEVVYAKCDTTRAVDFQRAPKKRLLWASRVDAQKRPERVVEIAAALSDAGIDVEIDAYGSADPGVNPEAIFTGAGKKVCFCGGFSAVSDLPLEKYDAFLYTSDFDGLPNILLEMLGAGLPAIAPDVGGICEAVIDRVTGKLVSAADEKSLVAAYVNAVKEIYGDWNATLQSGLRASELVQNQHGPVEFSRRVAEALDLACLNSRKVS
ncbi:glycosyltransferase [Stenotrophomonas koreensis]|uniref:glycosyltransferase n=1 Tax=Stenotrophomonas koreensis TaxID=266128 RepID=UPI0033964347